MTTKGEWIEYTGSDEQIDEMHKANLENGFIALWKDGGESTVMLGTWSGFSADIDRYLICNPHPYAEMIKRWADTGQKVYVKTPSNNFKINSQSIIAIGNIYCTNTPDWNIPGAEYSFTPFED